MMMTKDNQAHDFSGRKARRGLAGRAAVLLVVAAGCALSAAGLASCTQDAYDTGDGEYSRMRADFAEVYTDGRGRLATAMTDDGDSLLLTVPQERKWAATPDSAYRCLIYYNKVEQGAEPISIASVPTPAILQTDLADDTVKTDPVKFDASWKSRNGRYLNLALTLKTGQEGGETVVQRLGLFCDSVATAADGRRQVFLRLYHDQNNAPEYYSVQTYVSIMVARLPIRPRAGDQVLVSVNTYDGPTVRTFSF